MRLPQSQFKGESAFGFDKRFNMAIHTLSNVHWGLHLSFNNSKQIAPVLNSMLGWNIFVLNLHSGGETG